MMIMMAIITLRAIDIIDLHTSFSLTCWSALYACADLSQVIAICCYTMHGLTRSLYNEDCGSSPCTWYYQLAMHMHQHCIQKISLAIFKFFGGYLMVWRDLIVRFYASIPPTPSATFLCSLVSTTHLNNNIQFCGRWCTNDCACPVLVSTNGLITEKTSWLS